MNKYPCAPNALIKSMWENKGLIKASTKREIMGRYKGSMLGLIWSFFNPIMMLAIYTFVFSEIFKPRWNAVNNSKTEYALMLFIGLFTSVR